MRISLPLFALPLLALLAGSAQADTARPLSPVITYRTDKASAQSAFEQAYAALEVDLSSTSGSLEGQLAKDDVKVAESLYGLERRAIALVQLAESHELSSYQLTHDQTVGGVRSMLQRILRYQDRLKDHAQAVLDAKLPGEPERKLVAVRGFDGYQPLFRQATPKPGEAAPSDADRLAEMKADFADKGGDTKRDIKNLGIRYLGSLRSGELAEWTQLDSRHISVTTKGAKHPVIGNGKTVRGAGSMKIYRSDSGEIALVVVSNSSGNYKPGTGSVEGLVNKLVDLGVPQERILTTSVVPEEPELVKLLMKARMTFTKEQINDHVAVLKTSSKPRFNFNGVRAPLRPVVAVRGRIR